jgi:poly-beta-1,6-N-acetyl-D-glucosamine N-deacetylase
MSDEHLRPRSLPSLLTPQSIASLLFLLALIYVIAPTSLQLSHDLKRSVLRQSDIPAARISEADTKELPTFGADWDRLGPRPLMISYHDIALNPTSKYTVTPEHFAEQMALLDALHAHTLTASEYAAYAKGGPVPARSILLTFDDGARGVWRFADKVLARYNFKATAFIITGYVGTHSPYYMTWSEIEALHRSGRWSIEAHTHLGHRKIAVDANRSLGAFVSYLAWLPEGRLETSAEFKNRVSVDLDESAKQLNDRGYGESKLFAFPFSEYGRPSNDESTLGTLNEITSQRYVSVFSDDVRPQPLGEGFLRNRLSIESAVTNSVLINRLRSVIDLTLQPGQNQHYQPPPEAWSSSSELGGRASSRSSR